MRLIDADRLKEEVVAAGQESTRYRIGEFWELNRDEIWKVIDEQPTVETERKYGRWIPVTHSRGGFECCQCHCYAPSYADGVEWLSDFCPSCGADMRPKEGGI